VNFDIAKVHVVVALREKDLAKQFEDTRLMFRRTESTDCRSSAIASAIAYLQRQQ
jgi:hypothetical protein